MSLICINSHQQHLFIDNFPSETLHYHLAIESGRPTPSFSVPQKPIGKKNLFLRHYYWQLTCESFNFCYIFVLIFFKINIIPVIVPCFHFYIKDPFKR